MRKLLDVGMEILGKHPSKMYVFLGTEYGIKMRYASIVSSCFENRCIEYDSFSSLEAFLSTKHIVPVKPSLFIVRYDEKFASSLDESASRRIEKLKVPGCIVLIYQNSRYESKIEKYLGKYTVEISSVSPDVIKNYLSNEFLSVPSSLLNTVASNCSDYGQARNICSCLSKLEKPELDIIDSSTMLDIFGKSIKSTESQIKLGVASRNFKYLISALVNYDDEVDKLMYTLLSTLLELEKIKCSKYSDSPLKEYAEFWSLADIYNMFCHTYEELKKTRSYSNADYKDHLIYLFGLLQYSAIPSLEDMK